MTSVEALAELLLFYKSYCLTLTVRAVTVGLFPLKMNTNR